MKNFIKNVLALLIGIVMAFLIMEALLRVYNPFAFRVKGDKIVLPVNNKLVFKSDMSKGLVSKFDETIIHTTNSLGFRGEEPPSDFEKYLTIITVGGSTTECTFLSDGKTWSDLLERNLKRYFKNIWINNAGFDGHSTFGHLVLMEDYIVHLKPDIVLFLIGANDLGRDDLGEYDKAMMRDKLMFHSLKWFAKSMANHSEVFSMGLNLYRYVKARAIAVTHRELDFRVFRNRYLTDEQNDIEGQATQPHMIELLKGFKSRIKALIMISKDHNIEPVLITQPSLYGDFTDDETGINFSFTKNAWNELELYNDVTRRVGKEENILVIDLAAEMPKNTKYYYDWFHYTNEGSEKVSEIIYNNLYPYVTHRFTEYLIDEVK
jgi:lysophospholipase L1-like esterase